MITSIAFVTAVIQNKYYRLLKINPFIALTKIAHAEIITFYIIETLKEKPIHYLMNIMFMRCKKVLIKYLEEEILLI